MNKRVCLLIDSLSSGGAEKMVSNLSFSLSNLDYEVSIVSMNDEIVYPYSGELFNFGKIKKTNSKLNSFFKFKNYFKTGNFDVIIDHRVRRKFLKELVFSKIIFKNKKLVYCVHHYDLSLYFPCSRIPWLSKFTLVKNKKIIVVSKEIQNILNRTFQLDSKVIYNYVIIHDLKPDENSEISSNNEYIVGVGRLTKIKQFDVLIKCYKDSKLSQSGINLLILGDGPEKNSLNQLIGDLNLTEFVKLKGFKENSIEWIKKAKALILSSKSEGFPMVLIEALAIKTPVVSFDCKSGPGEIISHEKNGLLVEDQNALLMTEALNKLLNSGFYKKIKKNINSDLNPFSEEKLIKKWVDLIEN
jgi:N-acetylgalactosamine-N,N'-diacetylbacillosaminyl-diphospho-undecaprenol 4-alpha-N-acetylgalactosaminyltransferase